MNDKLKDIIRITDNPSEMKAIAREIMALKPDKYGEKAMAEIEAAVRKRMPVATDGEVGDAILATIYHYWVYGSTYDEYFYYGFARKTHAEKLEYMAFRVRLLYMDHLNPREEKHLLFNKYETYRLFPEYFKRDVILCSSEADWETFLAFTDKHPEFVVKPTDMSGGRGVRRDSVAGMDTARKRAFFGELLAEGTANREKFRRGHESSVVLEELIEQADEMAAFHPQSVNGVRVPTVNVDGHVHIYQPWFKVGRGGNFLTSAVFGTLDAGIDAETGIIDTPGMNETDEVFDAHPDSHIPFVGFQIPRWKELVDMARDCAGRLPKFGYVGWDFVLTKQNGWCVMEGNYSGDFMWQLYRQKGMKKEFEDLIGWKLDKQFWWEA
ncbi:MAG: hypothetical protein IKQ55_02210 [Kiritimatiellae bacterium]|nr:hypothetical protein [Kiritimatiellia bacterium]